MRSNLITAILLLCAAVSNAATITINPGDSIQAVAGIVNPGDTVIVRAGTYGGGPVTLQARHANTTWRSETKHGAVVQGFELLNGSGADGVTIDGFEITHARTGYYSCGVRVETNDVRIANNYIHDIQHFGIYGKADRVTVVGNHIYGCEKSVVVQGADWLVERNEAERPILRYGDDADYMRFWGTGHVFRLNYLHGLRRSDIGNSHSDGWQTWGGQTKNILWEYNLVFGFIDGYMVSVDEGDTTSIGDFTIKNNVFVGTTFDTNGQPLRDGENLSKADGSWGFTSRGFNSRGGTKNVSVENNSFLNIALYGVGIRNDGTGTVRDNVFYRVGYPYMLEQNDWPNNLDIGGNVIDQADGIAVNFPDDVYQYPQFASPVDILGPDGVPFTADDGWLSAYTAQGKGAQLPDVAPLPPDDPPPPPDEPPVIDPDYDALLDLIATLEAEIVAQGVRIDALEAVPAFDFWRTFGERYPNESTVRDNSRRSVRVPSR